MAAYYQPTCQGYHLYLHVVPGASRTEVAGLHGGRLKIKVAAPPEKEAANQELVKFLARRLGLKKNAVKLTLGAHSRDKVVAILDFSPETAARLQTLLPSPPDSPSSRSCL